MSNHPTTTDAILMMGILPGPLHILITEMVMNIPVLGWYLRTAGHIPVLDDNRRAAFVEAHRLIEAGEAVGIVPEGALSPLEGALGAPSSGVGRLALGTGAPVIPIGIAVRRELIRFRKTTVNGKTEIARHYRGPYFVTMGEALRFEGDAGDRGKARAVSELVMQSIGVLARRSAERMG